MTTTNKLSPEVLYTTQEVPPIAAAQPQIPKLARSSSMGTDISTTLVSVAIVFIVGLSTSFWWKLSKKVEPPPPQQERPLHRSDSESGSSHGTPQKMMTMMRSPTDVVGPLRKAITPVHDLNLQCTSTNPELVVIFFHGIGHGENDDWKETWTSTTSEGKRVCWPQEWLPADLATQNVNNVRILSLSYDSALLGANEDVTDIGKNLVESLVSKREYEPLWKAPIVLVGYSFGGLVVKSLIVEAEKRKNARIVNPLDARAKRSCTQFLENLKGTIFYGVPHTGGGGDFKQYFVYQSQRLNDENREQFSKSGILKNVEGFNRQMEALSVDFDIAVDPALIIYAFGEGQPVNRGESVLVPYASAQQLARRNHYKVEDATHITICQPTSWEAINYSKLKEVLAVVMEGTEMLSNPQSTHVRSQQSTHTLSQVRLLDTDSEIPSSSNTTPELENYR